MKAKLSLMGLYEYDNTIFDDMVLPDALTRSDVINNLLLQTASFSVVFPDPNFIKGAIAMWSRIHVANWEWLYNTQHYDYNPIWNVDVKDSTWHNNLETRDLAGTNYETRNLGGTDNETLNLTQTENGSRTLTNNGSDTVNNYVAAFNDTSETLTHRDRNVTEYGRGESETTQNTTTNTGTDNRSMTDTGTDHFDSTDTGTVNNEATTEFYKRGNQGVTTSQQMIREEQELAKKNLIDYITNEFKKEFCLLVYA